MSRPNDPTGSRREARETALEILYAAEVRETDILEMLAGQPVVPADYAVALVEGVAGSLDELDDVIGRYAEGWTTNRMPAVDRALLRAWPSTNWPTWTTYPPPPCWPRWWN